MKIHIRMHNLFIYQKKKGWYHLKLVALQLVFHIMFHKGFLSGKTKCVAVNENL